MSSELSVNVSTFDAIVLSVVALSALIAFFRGFIRELLSLGAWVGAALVTVYLFPHSTEFMKKHIHGSQSGTLAAGIGALGTYIAALLIFSIINSVILRYVKTGAEVGLLDNFLGLIFGGLRGAFIISLGYIITLAVVPKEPTPEWLKHSITRPYVEYCANLLSTAAPQYLHDIEGFIKREEDKAKEEKDHPDDSGTPAPRSSNSILRQEPPQDTRPYGGAPSYNGNR